MRERIERERHESATTGSRLSGSGSRLWLVASQALFGSKACNPKKTAKQVRFLATVREMGMFTDRQNALPLHRLHACVSFPVLAVFQCSSFPVFRGTTRESPREKKYTQILAPQ
jgi:hypothetical protein